MQIAWNRQTADRCEMVLFYRVIVDAAAADDDDDKTLDTGEWEGKQNELGVSVIVSLMREKKDSLDAHKSC